MARAKKARKASAKKPAAKKAKKTAKKARKAAPKKARKAVKKTTRKTAKKSTRKAAKKTAKKATKKTGRKAMKKTAKKATKKTAKKATKKAAPKKARAKRAPNPAFMKPLQPDAALSAVVGSAPQPRTEVTKKIWAYIKRNNLQDAKERRMINADDKLRAVFGGKSKVSMFEMTKLVNNHLK